jgi:hypothetical protein
MAYFISSNNNRFYVALESNYGVVPGWTSSDRCSGVQLKTHQTTELPKRRDKTGTRTYRGLSNRLRRPVDYEFRAYLTGVEGTETQPRHAAFFQAALGGSPQAFAGGTVAAAAGRELTFTANHGLAAGQALSCSDEIRFVAAVESPTKVILAAPFSKDPAAGAGIQGSVTYRPATDLPSLSIGDYWDPNTAVQRLIHGAAVDRLDLKINGGFHELHCSGPAADLIDTLSFESGQGGLSAFPVEPAIEELTAGPTPGHLGQVWLGIEPDRMYTLLDATLTVKNNVDLRSREFGTLIPQCLAPGAREVTCDFSLYERDDDATNALYQAARQRTPVSLMLQLGEAPGELCGVYLKSLVPEVPSFNDSEARVSWRFAASNAQGDRDDEIAVAFA